MSYRLPAEWSAQSGVMLTWPHSNSDWGPVLEDVTPVFAEIAREITLREKLLIVCHDGQHREKIKDILAGYGIRQENLRLAVCPSNDSWARDHGPITVFEKDKPAILDFRFNGWGNKYPYELDNNITETLFSQKIFGAVHHIKPDMVLEGGSIDVNGKGLLMTTSQCLLSATRNPGLNRQQIESRLADFFAIHHFIWLEDGHLQGDDTDAHIDTLARFSDENTIVYTACDDRHDEHYEPLNKMKQQLETATRETGQNIRLIPLPLPDAVFNDEGLRLPATYANFLIINDAVLVPVYGCANDKLAVNILGHCFTDRKIIEINCRPLIHQYGSLHCVTMQLPSGVLV